MEWQAFNPQKGANQKVSVDGTSSSITINPVSKSVRVVNSGSSLAYVRIGNGSQTATSADTPVAAGESLILTKADGEDTLAHIWDGQATTLHIQTGEGGV